MTRITQSHGLRVISLCGALCLQSLIGISHVHGQNDAREAAMAAYADAANFQTGGAINLAIDGWQSFLSKYPKHPMAADAAHYLGVCHMQQKTPDYVAAAKAFSKALQTPKYDLREESLANLGWCSYIASGEGEPRDQAKLKIALDAFQRLLKESPNTPFMDRALFYSGEAAYGMGNSKQAIQYYDRMLTMPNTKASQLRSDAFYARGVAYEELDQIDQALNSFKQLLENCDRAELITDVHLRMGDMLIMQKDYASAVQAFNNAIESTNVTDDRAYALFRQAFAHVQAGAPAEAAKKYDRLLAEYPTSNFASAAILASAQSTYRSGNIDEAAKRFRKVLQQKNLSAATEAAHWLSRIEINKRRPDEAVRISRAQIQRGLEGSFAVDLQLDLAEALSLDPKTLEQSMAMFEQIYRKNLDSPLASRSLYNAAFSALQIQNPQKALSLALEFIKRFPKDTLVPDIKFVAAESQLLTNQNSTAADTYTHLLESTRKDNIQRPIWILRTGSALITAERYQDVTRILKSELTNLPSSAQKAEAQLLIGQAFLKSGNNKQAATAFKASVATDSNWARVDEALLLSGQSRVTLGDIDNAIKDWKQVVKRGKNPRLIAQARYELGQRANASGKHADAIVFYDQVINSKSTPELVPYALYGKGNALMQTQEFDSAIEPLTEMLRKHPGHPLQGEAMLARGIARRNIGQNADAGKDLQTFLSTKPTGISLGHALYEAALIDQKEKQPERAASKLEALVRQVPDYPTMDEVLYELGWSLQESDNESDAIKYFSKLIQEHPTSPLLAEAAYYIGQKYYSKNRWKEAAKEFRLASSKAQDPGLAEKAYYRLGWSLFKTQDYAGSEQAFSKMATKFPEGQLVVDARTMVAECRFKRSDYQSALSGYEIARSGIQSRNETAKNVLDKAERQVRELVFLHGGQSAAQLKKWKLAIEWYNELRKRFPSSDYLPQIFYETGFAFQQLDDTSEALSFYQEVADNYRNATAARARFMMGEIHFSNRDYDKAIPEFQRVMYGFGADKAPTEIKNWQAKSGFEAGRCSDLLLQDAKTDNAKSKAKDYAADFYQYVTEKHPNHELAAKSRDRLEKLKQ
ncbi:tetratricopeptide repeat protein [Rhodopirellula sp.]|nr:tetratricopeptide repeat protein [Rhodopirellula sp.]